MQILVTGGTGYVGGVIVNKLVKAGHDVIVIGTLRHGRKDHLPSSIKFYLGDIGDVDILNEIFTQNKITHVIHCAAYINIGEATVNPIKYFDNNIAKAIKLLQVMESFGCKNIIFSSSCATYGVPQTIPLTESNPQIPITVYGWTKLVFEQMLGYMEKIHDFNVVILRYFNVAGAYIDGDLIIGENHNPEIHLIPIVINSLVSGNTFNINGTDYDTDDGTCIRDYIHVEDLADAHILALGKRGQFNLGGDRGYSIKEILDLVQKIGQQKLNISVRARRIEDLPILYADSTKFKLEFGWKPKHDIESIATSAYKWHLKKQNIIK